MDAKSRQLHQQQPRAQSRQAARSTVRCLLSGYLPTIRKVWNEGTKLPLRAPINERQVTAAVDLLTDCQGCPQNDPRRIQPRHQPSRRGRWTLPQTASQAVSPRIVEAIVDGTQPKGLTRNRPLESELSADWSEQEALLGLAA